MEKHIRIISITTLSLLGVFCISSGIMYKSLEDNNVEEKILVVVEQKQISKEGDVDLKLKNLTIEVNTPLSVKIIDYLDSAVNDEVLANLKLDTSNVNVREPGTYNYTISYKKKTYQGIIIVKEKEISTNALQSITLKTVKVNVNLAGSYQYTITFNNSIYTGTIVVTESQPTLSTNIGEQTPTNPGEQQEGQITVEDPNNTQAN